MNKIRILNDRYVWNKKQLPLGEFCAVVGWPDGVTTLEFLFVVGTPRFNSIYIKRKLHGLDIRIDLDESLFVLMFSFIHPLRVW